jgi:uracil DNA glycosylase
MINKIEFNDEVKKQFHGSWHKKIQSIIESPEVFNIFQFLKAESKKGTNIFPKAEDLFKPFMVDLNQLKVVMIFKEPFLNFQDKKTISPTVKKLQEAWLDDVYKGREEEIEKDMYTNDVNLDYLRYQGVMITSFNLNSSKEKYKEFYELWFPFWKLVYDKIFSSESGLIFIYFGNKSKISISNNSIHNVLECEDISDAIKENRKLYHRGIFSEANQLIKKNHPKKAEIEWLDILPF